MGCFVEFGSPAIRFDFSKNKKKQKSLVDVLLTHTNITIDDLASTLSITDLKLQDIQSGKLFLSEERAERLCQYFLIAFGS